MTGEQFFSIWSDLELRQHIVTTAKRKASRRDIAEDYMQEAWIAISFAPHDWETEAYKRLASKTIRQAHEREIEAGKARYAKRFNKPEKVERPYSSSGRKKIRVVLVRKRA